MYKNLAKSVKASLTASFQLSCLITARIDEWKGTDERFIIHWQEKIRAHEASVPGTGKWSDNMKMIILENSTTPLLYLKNVRHIAEQLKTHIGDAFSYDYHCVLLKLASQNHD